MIPEDGALEMLARSLVRAYQAARLYPEGHPENARARVLIAQACAQVTRIWPAIVIDFAGRCFEPAGAPPQPAIHGAAEELVQRGLEVGLYHYEITGPDAVDSCLRLVRSLLDQPVEEPGSRRGIVEESPGTSVPPLADAPPERVRPAASNGSLPEILREIWSKITARRHFDATRLDEMVHHLARSPGDGIIDPVRLHCSGDQNLSLPCHALNMGRLSYLLGRAKGLPPEEIKQLVQAALLCNIGMTVIPLSLWSSSKRLRPAEFRIVRRHPLHGARLLLTTPGTPLLPAVVAFEHHRRQGGGGYPQVGRRADPCAATLLIQVADVYAALRTPRPFRPAVAEGPARRVLLKLRGSDLDRENVDLLLGRTLPQGSKLLELDPAPTG